MLTEEQRREKRRLIRWVILFCLLCLLVFGFFEYRLLGGSFLAQPRLDTAIFFALLNVNALLTILMLFLVLRQLTEHFFERKRRLFGARLRGKLVGAFVALSFLPTTLLFLFAFGTITAAMDYWFNAKVEDSLQSAGDMMRAVFTDTRRQAEFISAQLAFQIQAGMLDPLNREAMQDYLGRLVAESVPGAPDSIRVLDERRREILALRSPRLLPVMLPPVASAALKQSAATGEAEVFGAHTSAGELVQAVAPARTLSPRPRTWFVAVSLLIPTSRLHEMRGIQAGLNDYRRLLIVKAPMKFSLIVLLVLVTLLIVFGSVWLGFYVARGLTTPINELALATRRVAEGDLEFRVERAADDEMGVLVNAFNAMTANLSRSRRELAQTHFALERSNEIAEQRRNYLETILEHVPAGVIALDEAGVITIINRFAVDLLGIDPARFLGRDFRETLPPPHAAVVRGFVDELAETGKSVVERHLRMSVRRGEVLSLQANVARMRDASGAAMGHVIVFDNLTGLEQAQRLAAWQEVARRVAHEIKNPLTPIQLSAQRLRKRYLPVLEGGREVFDQCTETIITQVDEIRKMVSEFSEFARMPKLNRERNDLAALIEGLTNLYQAAHPHLRFESRMEEDVEPFFFDAVQIKRVLINLLDNAVAVLDAGGAVTVSLRYDAGRTGVIVRVADNGPGIDDAVKLRIFDPYFSTRKSGTGLGLAICQTIVREHGGGLTVSDNEPSGAVFGVFLPLA